MERQMKVEELPATAEQLTRSHLAFLGMTLIGVQQLIDGQPLTDPGDQMILATFVSAALS